jgi:hypothetical protein
VAHQQEVEQLETMRTDVQRQTRELESKLEENNRAMRDMKQVLLSWSLINSFSIVCANDTCLVLVWIPQTLADVEAEKQALASRREAEVAAVQARESELTAKEVEFIKVKTALEIKIVVGTLCRSLVLFSNIKALRLLIRMHTGTYWED